MVVDPRTNNRYLITGREYVASSPGNAGPGNVVVPDGTDPSEYWSSPAEVTMWNFEKAGDAANQYYIKAADGAGAGKHLQLSATGVTLAESPMALTVTADGSRVTISTVVNGTTYYLGTGYNDSSNNKPGIDVSYFRTYPSNASNLARYNHLTLCDVRETSVDDPVYTGEKISVQEIEDYAADGSAYLIYKNVYDSATGQYESYVIDGEGNLVYAYENGDSISLHSAVDPRWFVSFCTDTNGNPNGYYIFKNATTGKCLRPSADGTFLCEIDDFTTMAPGVQLPGRSGGRSAYSVRAPRRRIRCICSACGTADRMLNAVRSSLPLPQCRSSRPCRSADSFSAAAASAMQMQIHRSSRCGRPAGGASSRSGSIMTRYSRGCRTVRCCISVRATGASDAASPVCRKPTGSSCTI